MQLGDDQINIIKTSFANMQTLEDLLWLINTANEWTYTGYAKLEPVRLKSITYYSNPKLCSNAYRSFEVAKKSGGSRNIHAPVRGLKFIQQALSTILQHVFEQHTAAKGFVAGLSIAENAKPHVGKHYVFNLDLKDFFPSVDKPRFWKRLQYPPFNLNDESDRLHLANRISALCFTQMEVERLLDGKIQHVQRDVLPQGAPSSPVITNIIAYRLDKKLTGLAKRFGCDYTRYADDITFSSMHHVYGKDGVFRKELEKIISSQHFRINEKKTRLQKNVHRQEVTGVVVNEKLNVKRRYIKQLRQWLYFWEKYGEEKAEELFLKAYNEDKGHITEDEASMREVINGKLLYLKMIKGEDDSTYTKLKNRYEALKNGVEPVDINKLLELWEQKGIHAAMKHYYRSQLRLDINKIIAHIENDDRNSQTQTEKLPESHEKKWKTDEGDSSEDAPFTL